MPEKSVDPCLIKEYAALFPDLEFARDDGLLCAGGDLAAERLLAAYSLGIFPWYSSDTPILWWSPNPRCIMPLDKFHLPRRSMRMLRKQPFHLTCNAAFGDVIRQCAQTRTEGTWITDEMIHAYETLHRLGYAHSLEAWKDDRLVGGLYGIGLGRAFFGESMFHLCSEASRAALYGLIVLLRQKGVMLLDCQQETEHMMRMGAEMIFRDAFVHLLREATKPHADSEFCSSWKDRPIWDAVQQCWQGVQS